MPYQKIILAIIVLSVLYAVVSISYPLIWATRLSKTEPPKNVGQVIFGSQNTSAKPLEVAVIGDSTAAGQGAEIIENSFSYQYLQTHLSQNQSIKYENFAVGGSRVDQVLESQVSKIPLSTDIIFVSIGANDVTAFISRADFATKIQELSKKLEAFSGAKVIWMSIPDFVTVPILLPPLNYFSSNRAKEFNSSIKDSLNQKNFVYVDVFDSTRNEFRNYPDVNFAKDKYHPSTSGYKLWSEAIDDTIEKNKIDLQSEWKFIELLSDNLLNSQPNSQTQTNHY